MAPWVWLAMLLLLLFVIGAVFGSYLNVCIARLPAQKSLLWPSSRCGHCLYRIPLAHNVPLLSYWLLGGRCRNCGEPFSARYFWVELLTGLGFAGLFAVEVGWNVHGLELWQPDGWWYVAAGTVPPRAWGLFAFHAVLLAVLIAASFCDLEHREIPLSLTATGTLIGLAGAVLFPWPWPDRPEAVIRDIDRPAILRAPGEAAPAPTRGAMSATRPWWLDEHTPRPGYYAWPVWGPLPAWLPPGSWQLGLSTGLAGAFAGTLLVRAVRYLAGKGLGVEAMGLGDADLMMMAGAFLGWQVVVVSFFVAVLPALVFGVVEQLRTGSNALPFGPSLAVGVLITWLCWSGIGPRLQVLLFNGPLLLGLVAAGGFGLFVLTRLMRRPAPTAGAHGAGS